MKQTWVHGKPKEHAIRNYEAVLIETMSKQKKKKKLYSKTSKHLEMGPQRAERKKEGDCMSYQSSELYHENCPVFILKRILNQCTLLITTNNFPQLTLRRSFRKVKSTARPYWSWQASCFTPPLWQLDHCWKRS